MSARLQNLAERRQALVARSDQERATLGASLGDLERRFAIVDAGVATARRIHRHRVLLGAATVWAVVAPVAARLWIGRLAWGLPLAIEGYRATKLFIKSRRSS